MNVAREDAGAARCAPKTLAIDTQDDALERRLVADASPSHSTSWLSLSDVESLSKLPTSTSSSSLASGIDLATYAPQQYQFQFAAHHSPPPSSPRLLPLDVTATATAAADERARRFSMSSASGVTLEDDIRSIGDQMKRVLAFCELQSQNPIRLQAKINDLQEQLQLAVAEKNYWMTRCKEMSSRTTKHEFPMKETVERSPDARACAALCLCVAVERESSRLVCGPVAL